MLTPLELDIMKAVWERPSITVREVQEAIRPHRKLAYTTVMTLMHRLFNKGFLTRKMEAKAHVYEPAVGYTDVRDAQVERLIKDFFSGSRDDLIGFLGGGPANGDTEVRRVPSDHEDLDETLL